MKDGYALCVNCGKEPEQKPPKIIITTDDVIIKGKAVLEKNM